MQRGRTGDQPLNASTMRTLRATALAIHGKHVHTVRRVLALVLLLAAGVLAVTPRATSTEHASVLVTTHDLRPGQPLTPADLVQRELPADSVPHNAMRDAREVIGRTTATAMRSGETVTDVRVLGPELTRMSTGDPDSAAVPVRLADPAVATFLRPGRHVDIVTATEQPAERTVLAERAPVVGVREPDTADEDKLVLVGLPRESAAEVAATAMTRSVTVTLR